MRGLKRYLSILLVLTLIFTSVIFPSAAMAAPQLPNVAPKPPSMKPMTSYKTMEAPSTIGGVDYKFDPKVINLPAEPYTLEDIPQPGETGGGQTGSGKPSAPATGPVLPGIGATPSVPGAMQPPAAASGRELPMNAKNLVVNRGALDPKIGNIYFDPETNGAFKVIGGASANNLGKMEIPVVKPGVDEVFQQFSIPNQTLKLTDGNIDFANMAEGVEYIGIENEKTAMASAGRAGGLESPFERQGNTYIFRLKNFTIYEYPNPKDPEEVKKAKEEQKLKDEAIKKAKEEGTYDYLANYEWTGAKNKSTVGVKIQISEGIVKVTDPTINFDMGWDTLLSPVGNAHCDIDMKIDSNVTIDGNIKFKEERWQQIYGYLVCDKQKDPTVRIYIGIFAVIGLEGELSFKVKVKQVGEVHHGIDMYFSSLVAPGVPLGIVPSGSFNPESQSVGIVIDGRVKATAGVMAGLGIEIFDFKVIQLQIRLGLEGDCTFHVEMGDTGDMEGGGNAPPGGAYASASFKLYFFVGINAALVGIDIPIFNKKFLLVDKSWSGTLGPSGNAGAASGGIEQDLHCVQVFIDKADAAEDIIEGHVLIVGDSLDPVPYQGEVAYQTLVYDAQGRDLGIREYRPTADAEGKFTVNAPLSPFDYAIAGVYVSTDMDIYRGHSMPIRTTVPYSVIDFVPDAFNNLVYGTVSGQYSGPLTVKVARPGKPVESIQINANKGDFGVPVTLNAGDKVNVLLNFEGMDIWARPDFIPASIDSLRINFAPGMGNEAAGSNAWDAKGITAGSIENTMGITPYTGQVELNVDKVVGYGSDTPVRIHLFSGTQPASLFGKGNSGDDGNQLTVPKAEDRLGSLPLRPQLTTNVQNIFGQGRPISTENLSLFKFDDTPIDMGDREFAVTIEYKGIQKTEVVSHAREQGYESHVSSHGFEGAVSSPKDNIFNPIGNPADISAFSAIGMDAMNIPQDVMNRASGMYATGQQQQASFVPSNMPSQTFALNAAAGDSYVNLEWKPFIGDNVVGYNIYRGTSSKIYGMSPIKSLGRDDTGYTDKDVINGTIYYYTIKAVFSDNTESASANEVSAEPIAPAAPATPIKPPSAPIKPPVIPKKP